MLVDFDAYSPTLAAPAVVIDFDSLGGGGEGTDPDPSPGGSAFARFRRRPEGFERRIRFT